MNRKTVVSSVLVLLFLVSVFRTSISSGTADSHGTSGFPVSQSILHEDSTDLNSSALIPELCWTQGDSFPVVNGCIMFPTQPPLALTPTGVGTHWYAGSQYPSSEPNRNARTINMSIAIPSSAPRPEEFYYVLLSAFDDNGSYDQIGFANDYGTWGLTYSWTTGRTLNNLTYNFSPNAMVLSLGVTYTFCITTQGSFTYFTVYQGSNQVWSLAAPTGGSYLVLSDFYSGYYDYTDYEEVWTTATPGGSPDFDFYFYNNYAVLTDGSGFVTTWTQMYTWSAPFALPDGVTAIISGNSVLVKNPGEQWLMFHHDLWHNGYSTSPAPNTSQVLWKNKTGDWVGSSPAVVDGVVFIGSGDSNVYAFNASNGVLIWKTPTNAPVYSSPAVADGKVYVGSGSVYATSWNGGFYCLNASSGTVIWSSITGSPVESSPAVADGMVFVGSCNNNVYALDENTGSVRWSYTTGGWVDASSPAVADGMVFVGSNDTRVYALNETSGTQVWNYPTGGYVESSPAVADGMVFVGSCNSNVYALNEFTGARIWSYRTGSWVESSPAVVGGMVFVGSDYPDDNVYALNASTGRYIWNYKTVGQVDSSPGVADGKVYVGSWNAYGVSAPAPFYCLNASTGAFIWSYETNSATLDSSPAIVGSIVYVGADDPDDHVYAFETPYNATIEAHCITEGADINVRIAMEGSSTGYTTPHTFINLTGTHTFTVANTDPSGHPFLNWSTGETYSTTTVSSAGTYIAYYEAPPPTYNVTISPTSATLDVGQSQLFTSTVSGGTSPYAYQWYLTGALVSGAISPTWTWTPTFAGSYTVYLKVTDSASAIATSNTVSVTVNGPLSITITPSSATISTGQSQLFTSTVSGGTSPFAYKWYLNGTAVPSATSSTWTFTPSSKGSYRIYANVTDSAGFTAKSNIATLTVTTVSITISPTSVTLNVGQSQLFTSSVSGGASPYSYQWYLNGAPVPDATSSTWTFTPSSVGIYTVYVNVTDNVGVRATSNTATATVTLVAVNSWPMFRYDLTHTGYQTSTARNTQQTIWNYTTGGYVSSSPAVVGGVVFVGSEDHKVYALNATMGTQIWSYTTGGPVSLCSPAVVGGVVYVGSNDHKVYALNATMGTQIWSYTTGNVVWSSPAVVGGVVYVGSADGKVYALNAMTGALVWSYTTGGSSSTRGFAVAGVWSSPAVAGGVVYVGSYDNKTYALNATTGALVWSYTTGDVVDSSPAVVGGVVYVGSNDSNVYALNAATGALIWKYTTGGGVYSSPAVANGVVYVGSWDGKIYALNATTGAQLWRYTIDYWWVWSSPAVAGRIVYVASQDGNVYALNAMTGTLVWTYVTGSAVDSSPAVVGGVVYVGSNDGKVYAFGASGLIPGDINGDGKVDLKDLVLLAQAYGSKPGDGNWNSNADINGNGVVDLADLVILTQNYGKTDP